MEYPKLGHIRIIESNSWHHNFPWCILHPLPLACLPLFLPDHSIIITSPSLLPPHSLQLLLVGCRLQFGGPTGLTWLLLPAWFWGAPNQTQCSDLKHPSSCWLHFHCCRPKCNRLSVLKVHPVAEPRIAEGFNKGSAPCTPKDPKHLSDQINTWLVDVDLSRPYIHWEQNQGACSSISSP